MNQYEVLSPWPDVDPVPLRGISPRLTDLTGKTIGLYCSVYKIASRPILAIVEEKLKQKFPTLKFSWFMYNINQEVTQNKDDKARFVEWAKGVDAVVSAVGD